MTSDFDSSFDAMLREAAELRLPATDATRLPEPGELLQEKYRIEQPLGEGGMGVVFRATHVENGKQVAVKWLLGRSPQAALRFSREARFTAQIDHPNVVNVFDVGSHRGGRFLVMELLRGQSLGARIRKSRLEPRELVEIMIPVLRGVAAAHHAGVIHRDLKPDNIFLCVGPDGAAREPKVLDFGISKLRSTEPLDERLTREGTGLGTLAYMSPEQLSDALNVTEQADIYAAGVMMYEALVGRLPFRAESYNALVLAIAAQRPLPMSELVPTVPSSLERIVMRAMASDARSRHPDVRALIEDLESWRSQSAAHVQQERQRAVTASSAQEGSASRRIKLAMCLVASFAMALWLAVRPTPSVLVARSARRAQAEEPHMRTEFPGRRPPGDVPAAHVRDRSQGGPDGTRTDREQAPGPAADTQKGRLPARSQAGKIRLSEL